MVIVRPPNFNGSRAAKNSIPETSIFAEVVLTFLSFEFDRVYQLKRCVFLFWIRGFRYILSKKMERWKDLIQFGSQSKLS